MTRKPDRAEIELQLSERRFILESLQTVAQLLQVPLVTAGVWFYISRTNAAMGALNKAILAAELAPIVGDIEFPPWSPAGSGCGVHGRPAGNPGGARTP